MRWCFLILLLINSIYFGWQLRQADRQVSVVLSTPMNQLRLLSEEDRSLLLPRQVTRVKAEPVETWCQVVSGIGSEALARQWQERLELMGLTALVRLGDVEQQSHYLLSLEQPMERSAQQALERYLRSQDVAIEIVRHADRWVYMIGRYDSRSDLNRARDRWHYKLPLVESVNVSSVQQFELWIEVDSSLKTGNKISELEDLFDSAIKIEKKLCKGVASMGARD